MFTSIEPRSFYLVINKGLLLSMTKPWNIITSGFWAGQVMVRCKSMCPCSIKGDKNFKSVFESYAFFLHQIHCVSFRMYENIPQRNSSYSDAKGNIDSPKDRWWLPHESVQITTPNPLSTIFFFFNFHHFMYTMAYCT
jgi:hypothetical protein